MAKKHNKNSVEEYADLGVTKEPSSVKEEPEYTEFKPYEVEVTTLLNIRELPSKNAKVKMLVEKGMHLVILEEKKDWGLTKYGWLMLDFTQKV